MGMFEPKIMLRLRHLLSHMPDKPFNCDREQAQSLLDHIDKGMHWQPISDFSIETIEDRDVFLVKTNGGEWRDVDVHKMNGYRLKHDMRPEMVRGKPLWVIKLKDTPDGAPINAWA